MTAGCEPTNQLWYADIQTLPRDPTSGALDFSSFDKRGGKEAKPLPVNKVVSNFEASYDYVANEVFQAARQILLKIMEVALQYVIAQDFRELACILCQALVGLHVS